jgi:hypothetical protein
MPAFSYNINVTGDCGNIDVGKLSIELIGATPPYTVEFISPITETFSSVTSQITLTGLSATTYVVRVNDSSLPVNEEYYINIPISNGVCGSVVSLNSTSCGLNNGLVVISATSLYSSTNFALFDSSDTFISSAITNTSQFEFNNLSPDTYYCVITDLGGCTGITADFIIENSLPLNFGLFTVPNTSCGGEPTGKIYVTGQTGVAPYTYLWSNGQTSSFITGLTEGSYSVIVSDSNNCSQTRTATISNILPVGLGVVSVIQPQAFTNDGVISVTSSGGTGPYYYSASTGSFEISYSQTWVLTGLPAGDYIFSVTDAAFCNYQTEVSLLAANGISSVEVDVINSSSNPDGSITAIVTGGFAPYTYRLIYPNSNVVNVTNNLQTYTFSNLESGEYILVVEDSNQSIYSDTFLLVTEEKFYLTVNTTGTTCNQDNGIVQIAVNWEECTCCTNNFSIFNKDIISASGNTNSNLDGKVWVEYISCDGELTTQSFSIPNTYQFCSNGNCYSAEVDECFVNNLCCEWRVFNEGETDNYTYTDCDGNSVTISVIGGEYSSTFCGIDPPQIGLFSLEHIGSCSSCDCYDATTDGVFEYFDCNNISKQGTSTGVSICVNKNRPYSGIILGSSSSSCDCNTPSTYIWQDNNKVNLPEGYFSSTNLNCCVDNGPIFPITYNLDNGNQIISNTTLTNVLFPNLSSGSHTIIITDSSGYFVTENFIINNSGGLDFILFSESCGDGNDGSISVLINNGEPPFTFQWSENVPGNPQDILVQNLSADTYTLTLTDSNGCCSTRVTTIECFQNLNPYLYYTMGEKNFEITPSGKCSLLKLLNEGYQELIKLFSGCKFRFAEFNAKVSVIPSGYITETMFFTSYSLDSVPTDEQWADTLVSLISTIPGVYSVTSNLVENEILVLTVPGSTELIGKEIRIELIIDYTFECEEVS